MPRKKVPTDMILSLSVGADGALISMYSFICFHQEWNSEYDPSKESGALTGSRLPLSRGSRRGRRAAASLSVKSALLLTSLPSLLGGIETAGVVGDGVFPAVAEDSGVLDCSRRAPVAFDLFPEAG